LKSHNFIFAFKNVKFKIKDSANPNKRQRKILSCEGIQQILLQKGYSFAVHYFTNVTYFQKKKKKYGFSVACLEFQTI
jgi:hypothetical protein